MPTVDANFAVADVAYRINEVIAIYPITPASPMGEHADAFAAERMPNIWGAIPGVTELQSEGGAAASVHGALQAGSLATSFTASQGLLLMIPSMYKIAGELTACVLHISARTVATHALSIFCDHSDVYGARSTGFGMLASTNVQEAHDFALISQAASLRARVPFLHFFDGFRTSHEVAKVERLDDEQLKTMIDDDLVKAHRDRALSPDHPTLRGTAQNPDAFFQARESLNSFYEATPQIVQETIDQFAKVTGRQYGLVSYCGHPEAERVVVLMASGAETARETAKWLQERDEKVGVVTVHLYRPFPMAAFVDALPKTVKTIGVLDRTKEPGAPGDPLYLDVLSALHDARQRGDDRSVNVVGGRYGLSSKEFTPGMVAGVFEELKKDKPKNYFTVGINDDVTNTSLSYDADIEIMPEEVTRALFYGLGSDGTVGASKNSVEIISENTGRHAQGYFVYDSKKAGAVTVSHLRFGKDPIRAPYLINKADFIGVHQWSFVDRYDVLNHADKGATVILNAPFGPDEVWNELPREMQMQICERDLKLYVIDAYDVARKVGMGSRVNTIMQTCFFAISGVLPPDDAIREIKESIEKSYSKRGRGVVEKNFAAVDSALSHMKRVEVPSEPSTDRLRPPLLAPEAPDFVQNVTRVMLEGKGDLLPVSAFAPDGTWPTDTARWEKRNIALEIPVWDEKLCIQCNKCVLVCPHAAIRAKVIPKDALTDAPETLKSVPFKSKLLPDSLYLLQVAPEDCTGCTLCVEVCPAKDKSNPKHKAVDMVAQPPLREAERDNFDYFLTLPEVARDKVKLDVKHTQLFEPLFEFSGACAGCGETPYVKLLTQLFGDRLLIANATGCSSIYGGNLPTTPYAVDSAGRGPSWSNSLFEDNAEFGLGFRLAVDQNMAYAKVLLGKLGGQLGDELVSAILEADQSSELGLAEQRERIATVREKLQGSDNVEAKQLLTVADYLVHKSIWALGGDGWAYDIGYGGLDHALASAKNLNVLVVDTEVYSNTGGQQSKATPLGAIAKFAAAGKPLPKKDLGMLAMGYGNVYVASIAFGADDRQTLKAFLEAESYPGASIIIAYSHCIAHGYDMARGLDQQDLAVKSGYWPLYRFDPRRAAEGKNPLQLDSKAPKASVKEFAYNEMRFRQLASIDPERAKNLIEAAQKDTERRYQMYKQLADAPGAKS